MGSAGVQGDLWSAAPEGWTEIQEHRHVALYEAVLAALRLEPAARVLDAGCGSGVFAGLAVDAGARVSGLDAAPELIERARERVPEADFRVGDLEALPWEDGCFDVVTAFNSVFYAADPIRAIDEMVRVTRTGGQVAVTIGGGIERSDLSRMIQALRPLFPPPPPGGPAQVPVSLSDLDTMRTAFERAGLEIVEQVYVSCPFDYPDLDAAIEAMTAGGPTVAAIRHSGREAVVTTLREFFAPRTAPDGSIRMDVVFRYALGRRARAS